MAKEKDQFTATHRFARISAQKARLVMDLIRGEPVEQALVKLRFCQRRASPMISKVVRSALANALQGAGVEAEALMVWKACVDDGPSLKRWRHRAMGRMYPRRRRTCHLSVILKQGPKREGRGKKKEGRAKADGASPTSPAKAPAPAGKPASGGEGAA